MNLSYSLSPSSPLLPPHQDFNQQIKKHCTSFLLLLLLFIVNHRKMRDVSVHLCVRPVEVRYCVCFNTSSSPSTQHPKNSPLPTILQLHPSHETSPRQTEKDGLKVVQQQGRSSIRHMHPSIHPSTGEEEDEEGTRGGVTCVYRFQTRRGVKRDVTSAAQTIVILYISRVGK